MSEDAAQIAVKTPIAAGAADSGRWPLSPRQAGNAGNYGCGVMAMRVIWSFRGPQYQKIRYAAGVRVPTKML